MYQNIYQRRLNPVWVYALLLFGLFWAVGAQAASYTPAGTKITNLATVTYQDNFGNDYTAKSNESVVTVAKIYVAELHKDQTLDGAPNTPVYFPHQLINNGNIEDTFTLSAVDSDGKLTDLIIYEDKNGNGQPDSGEPEISKPVTVAAGSTLNLIVEAKVPATGQGPYTLELTATSTNKPFKGKNTETNTDTVIVSTGPVLVTTKEMVDHKPATDSSDGQVTYKITIKNNGSDLTASHNATISDPLSTLLDVKAGKKIGEETGVNIAYLNPSFDKTSFEVKNETRPAPYPYKLALNIGINNIKAGQTVDLTYTVKYKNTGFDANEKLKNQATVSFEHNGPKSVDSNLTEVTLPQFYGVQAHDRDNTAHNETHPDDQLDTDTVDSVAKGEVVEFKAYIKNSGNGSDRFKLSTALEAKQGTNPFPAGTTFTYWDSTGAVQYTDATIPNLNKGQGTMVTVKATLPSGTSAGQVNYTAKLTATSLGEDSKNASLWLHLVQINDVTYGVDLSYTEGKTPGDDTDPYNAAKQPGVNSKEAEAGQTVHYTFYLHNDSTKPRAFNLTAHKSLDGQLNGYTEKEALDASWNVTFKQGGKPISNTGYIKADDQIKIDVEVKLPEGISADRAGTDYEFAVLASSDQYDSKISDAVNFFVIVKDKGTLELTPDGSNQIEPGGAVFYNHQLINNTNGDLYVVLSDKQAPSNGWSHILLKPEALPKDAEAKLENNQLKIKLPGKQKLDLKVKVFAPATAQPGSKDTFELIAKETNDKYEVKKDGLTAEATDTTTVIKGQVRLYKKAAVLKGVCTADSVDYKTIKSAAEGTQSFNEIGGDVTPGEDCVVWQLIAVNEGDTEAKQVTISDAAPEFTQLVKDSAQVISGGGEVVTENTNSGEVIFNVGDDVKNGGGDLKPGQSVEVRFTVKVD